jgi:hypothetical protein
MRHFSAGPSLKIPEIHTARKPENQKNGKLAKWKTRNQERTKMDKAKAAQRKLEKRGGQLWFGARISMVLPTLVPAVVLITTDEPQDAAYDAIHYVKSTEHYISSRELLEVATDGRGLTDEQTGALLAGLLGTRSALAHLVQAFDQAHLTPIVDQPCPPYGGLLGIEAWDIALKSARSVLDLPLVNLEEEQEHP